MNSKHLREISVIQTNIITRQLGKCSKLPQQHEFQVSKRILNLSKNKIQTQPFPSPEVWSRTGFSLDFCKGPNSKFLSHKLPHEHDQRRNYSSLIQKIKNFMMSLFNKNSVPLLKAGEAAEAKKDEANKLKVSASSPTPTPTESEAAKSEPTEKSKDQKFLETKGEITETEPKSKDKRHDLVAESLMKETAQRLEVENKRKLPLDSEKGPFAEDRIAMEMPKKRKEKLELEQEMKEQRAEETKEAEMYNNMEKPKKAPVVAKKLETSKLCDHDDVFCGVEQFDDVKQAKEREGQATQVLAAKRKTTQVFTSKGQVKPTGMIPKYKQTESKKKYSTSAIPIDIQRHTEASELFTNKQQKRFKVFSIGSLEAVTFNHRDKNIAKEKSSLLMASASSKIKRPSYEDFQENDRERNVKSSWMSTVDGDVADGTMMIIQEDPLEIFEQKEPKSAIEMKEPSPNPRDLIEPINKEPLEDFVLRIPLKAKDKENTNGKDAKEDDKHQKEDHKGEKLLTKIQEPCPEKKPLCCYNIPKPVLDTDLTDKCNVKCAIAPQNPPPLIDCSICRKYETLKDDVPKPKPMVCKVRKCSKSSGKYPPSDVQVQCTKTPKHKAECVDTKAKAKQSSRSCIKQTCIQQTCPKGKPKPVVCPSMPKACMPKPEEKQTKECKKKTCAPINTASKAEEAKKKVQEREREKKCHPKKKIGEIDARKVLSECEKKKLKEEDDKKVKEEISLDPKLHTEWKAVPIKGQKKWCDKEGAKQERKEPTSKTVTPNTQKKYQSPRYHKKPSSKNSEPKDTKKCIPIGIIDVSQSLAVIENFLHLNNESDNGNEGGENKKSPEVLPTELVEKSKSDSKIL